MLYKTWWNANEAKNYPRHKISHPNLNPYAAHNLVVINFHWKSVFPLNDTYFSTSLLHSLHLKHLKRYQCPMILFLHQVPHTLLIPYFWQCDFFHDTQQDFSNTTFKAISIFLHYTIIYNVSHSLYHLLQRKILCTKWSLSLRTKSLCSHLEISLFLLLPIKRRDTIFSIPSATCNKSLLGVLTGMLNKDK